MNEEELELETLVVKCLNIAESAWDAKSRHSNISNSNTCIAILASTLLHEALKDTRLFEEI